LGNYGLGSWINQAVTMVVQDAVTLYIAVRFQGSLPQPDFSTSKTPRVQNPNMLSRSMLVKEVHRVQGDCCRNAFRRDGVVTLILALRQRYSKQSVTQGYQIPACRTEVRCQGSIIDQVQRRVNGKSASCIVGQTRKLWKEVKT
jgi:hypothetical protein